MTGGVLATRMVEKVWGRDALPAPFVAPAGARIGEIWFEPPPALDSVLAKYIFTSENLSVQVHPGEGQRADGGPGKEECWLILDAEPGACVALGFREAMGADAIRAAALDGTIEGKLHWQPVKAGDFIYLPAGTVHAIGAGIALVEVQQATDVTYRLYDYGRPRELHLDDALRVAHGVPFTEGLVSQVDSAATAMLVEGPYFRLAHVAGGAIAAVAGQFPGAVQVLPLQGTAMVAGAPVAAGGSGWAASLDAVHLPDTGRCLIAAPI